MEPPSKQTLARYGLSADEWLAILKRQGGCCGVCKRRFGVELKPQTDHEHVRGFAKMPAEKRKTYVRGILCPFDNHYVVGRHKASSVLLSAGRYLQRYERSKS